MTENNLVPQPDEPDAWRTRTAPVRVLFDVLGEFYDFGLSSLQYDEEIRARDQLHKASATDDAALALFQGVRDLYHEDVGDYADAFRATVRQIAAERGLTCPVEVVDVSAARSSQQMDALGVALYAAARERTPLPATGQAPDWSDGTPADAVVRAGATYTARAQAAAR